MKIILMESDIALLELGIAIDKLYCLLSFIILGRNSEERNLFLTTTVSN